MEKDRVLPFLGHFVLDLDPFNIIDNKHMAIESPFFKRSNDPIKYPCPVFGQVRDCLCEPKPKN